LELETALPKEEVMAKKKGLITGKPTTHNPRDMLRIRKLKEVARQAKKAGEQIERQSRKLKDACAKILKDLDSGWES
jgi:hypothetical protein